MRIRKDKSAAEIEFYLRKTAKRLEEEIEVALEETTEEAKRYAIELSSGTVTQKQLDAAGNPYATRHRRGPSGRFQANVVPYGDPAIINAQSAEFIESWLIEPPEEDGGGMTARLTNTAPYAHWLTEGTDKMIRRPILDRIEKHIRTRLKERVREAILAAFERD